jgi:hypothetical protein
MLEPHPSNAARNRIHQHRPAAIGITGSIASISADVGISAPGIPVSAKLVR